MADGLLTYTNVPFNSCCCYVIITSLIVSVLGLEALTFSPQVTCSVALNVNTRMSFWNVHWERGSERADSHQQSVLSHDYFGDRPLGLLRCGQGAQKVKSGAIIPLVPVFLYHSFFPPIYSIQQLQDWFGPLTAEHAKQNTQGPDLLRSK